MESWLKSSYLQCPSCNPGWPVTKNIKTISEGKRHVVFTTGTQKPVSGESLTYGQRYGSNPCRLNWVCSFLLWWLSMKTTQYLSSQDLLIFLSWRERELFPVYYLRYYLARKRNKFPHYSVTNITHLNTFPFFYLWGLQRWDNLFKIFMWPESSCDKVTCFTTGVW